MKTQPATASVHYEFLAYCAIIVKPDKSTYSVHGLETEELARRCAMDRAKEEGLKLRWKN